MRHKGPDNNERTAGFVTLFPRDKNKDTTTEKQPETEKRKETEEQTGQPQQKKIDDKGFETVGNKKKEKSRGRKKEEEKKQDMEDDSSEDVESQCSGCHSGQRKNIRVIQCFAYLVIWEVELRRVGGGTEDYRRASALSPGAAVDLHLFDTGSDSYI
ncbi:hypothetical protein DPMN_082669 [Dreissena polymorpha]|uniref:Uncharacterized protein n=1 Tax=Dreissena polymorpha TaxID=45954 RepID=A0A9D4BHI4_DREPO|nr:hypothetical protein DPMN_082669 [Dreissena polymorpha]